MWEVLLVLWYIPCNAAIELITMAYPAITLSSPWPEMKIMVVVIWSLFTMIIYVFKMENRYDHIPLYACTEFS